MIITKESLKSSFTTIEQLLTHKFFVEFVTKKNMDVILESVKDPPSLKEGKNSIKSAIQKFETRLKEEQKLVNTLDNNIYY